MNLLLAGLVTPEEQVELERKRLEEQDKLKKALAKVMKMALVDTGGGRVCRDFLLSLYNGHAFPFNMNGFRNLDGGLYSACITIMQIDCRPCPPKEIHEWWANGNEIFQQLIANRKMGDL